jgi:hypothetical protein
VQVYRNFRKKGSYVENVLVYMNFRQGTTNIVGEFISKSINTCIKYAKIIFLATCTEQKSNKCMVKYWLAHLAVQKYLLPAYVPFVKLLAYRCINLKQNKAKNQ